jgi:hypothetical protein
MDRHDDDDLTGVVVVVAFGAGVDDVVTDAKGPPNRETLVVAVVPLAGDVVVLGVVADHIVVLGEVEVVVAEVDQVMGCAGVDEEGGGADHIVVVLVGEVVVAEVDQDMGGGGVDEEGGEEVDIVVTVVPEVVEGGGGGPAGMLQAQFVNADAVFGTHFQPHFPPVLCSCCAARTWAWPENG